MQNDKNTLYYGDNLFILREYISTESVDLIYLDPPFNSNRSYNVLFKDEHGLESEAQIKAFDDTWHWGLEAENAYAELLTESQPHVAKMVESLRDFIGSNQMMAYLVMMTIRLIELHRVLKANGSLYLHCDPTACHYLKILLDTIFGPAQFHSEIIWRRTNAHNKLTRQYGPIHDTILFYSKTDNYIFHPGVTPYSKAYITDRFSHQDERGIYQTNYLTGPGVRYGESGLSWKGFDPTAAGRHWAIPKSLREFLPQEGKGMSSHEQLDTLYAQGFILFPKKSGGQPMYKQYIGKGVPYQDIWAYQPNTRGVLFNSDKCIDEDVKYLEDEDEKLGYETQKPLGLLERIINTSSDPESIILDPFCGCGTAIAVAQKLKRRWIGIDITHLSITTQKNRLKEMFPGIQFKTVGEPTDVGSARQLSIDDRYQFQWWALSLIPGTMPLGGQEGSREGKKGSDKGIDGILTFIDDPSGKAKRAIVQVKSGHVNSSMIRDLLGTVQREQAAMGVFITLENPTRDMLTEALTAGFYTSLGWRKKYPVIQIYTVEELLRGAEVKMPPRYWLGKRAKVLQTFGEQKVLDLMPAIRRPVKQP